MEVKTKQNKKTNNNNKRPMRVLAQAQPPSFLDIPV